MRREQRASAVTDEVRRNLVISKRIFGGSMFNFN